MTSTLPPLVQAFSGAIGSASANALTYPLDLVLTRLQLDSPRRSRERGGIPGAIALFKHIYHQYGVEAFYDGLWADTCATLLSNFFYFYFYSFLRLLSTKRLIPLIGNKKSGKPHKPDLFEELLLGFIAGVASRAISTPLNLVTLKMQTEREFKDEKHTKIRQPAGIIDALKFIYKEHGLIGFWRGFQMNTLLSLNPSITLACFQVYRRVLEVLKTTSPRKAVRIIQQKGLTESIKNSPAPTGNPNPWEAFFGAATSNAIAVSILYPLILGKKRLQASEKNVTMSEVLVDAYLGKELGQSTQDADTEHSIEGLYQGWSVKVIAGFLSQGVTFLVKSRIEQVVIAAYLLRLRRRKLIS